MNRITLLCAIAITTIPTPFPLLAQTLDSSSIASGRQVAVTIETGLNARTSAYGFCFTAILNHLLRDAVFTEILGRSGVDITFVVESGNANDDDVKRIFSEIRAKQRLEHKLNSIAFHPKDSSRALQLADFFAFYSRRHVEATERAGGQAPEEDFFIEHMQNHIYVIGEVATDFHAAKPAF